MSSGLYVPGGSGGAPDPGNRYTLLMYAVDRAVGASLDSAVTRTTPAAARAKRSFPIGPPALVNSSLAAPPGWRAEASVGTNVPVVVPLTVFAMPKSVRKPSAEA